MKELKLKELKLKEQKVNEENIKATQPKRIFITGGTGFLGQRTVALLEKHFTVTVLSRNARPSDAKFLIGDLKSWNAGVDSKSLEPGQYDLMLHMAGLYDLRAGEADSYIHNVVATNHALALAQKLKIPKFIFTSSVAASINSPLKQVKPYDLLFTRPFPDFYSEAKALCEQMIYNWSDGPSLKVNLRLGILTGDTQTGEIERIDGPYHAYRAFEKARTLIEKWPGFLPLPGDDRQKMPFVPVDIAAEAIRKFCEWTLRSEEEGNRSFHLVPTLGVGVRDFYKSILKNLFIRHQKIYLLEGWPLGVINPFAEHLLNFPREELTYLLKFPAFDTTSTRLILGDGWCPEYGQYEKTLWRGYEKFISNR